MSEQVWPVSIGSYSDYTVVMVCETEELARQVADHLNANKTSKWSDDYAVDLPITVLSAEDGLPQKVTTWRCVAFDDGRVECNTSEQWSFELHQGGNRAYTGGVAYGYADREEAEREALAWREIK